MSVNNKNDYVYKLTVSGLLIAVGVVIPRIVHILNANQLGKVLLPMHITVFIAGIFLGGYYGFWIGLITPLLNSLFGAPPFPISIVMAIELSAYGIFSGVLMSAKIIPYKKALGRNARIYISLIGAMIIGRVIYGLALLVAGEFIGLKVPKPLSIIGATISGIPGIIIQLIFVPLIVHILNKQLNNK